MLEQVKPYFPKFPALFDSLNAVVQCIQRAVHSFYAVFLLHCDSIFNCYTGRDANTVTTQEPDNIESRSLSFCASTGYNTRPAVCMTIVRYDNHRQWAIRCEMCRMIRAPSKSTRNECHLCFPLKVNFGLNCISAHLYGGLNCRLLLQSRVSLNVAKSGPFCHSRVSWLLTTTSCSPVRRSWSCSLNLTRSSTLEVCIWGVRNDVRELAEITSAWILPTVTTRASSYIVLVKDDNELIDVKDKKG